MNNLAQRRERYLKDNLQIRLGGLAANLARIGSFVKNPNNREAVKSLIEESKFFIEWTACDAEVENSAKLIELQIEIALRERQFENDWDNEESRLNFGQQAKIWSEQVLQNAGLI
jgi:hypothetical protein